MLIPQAVLRGVAASGAWKQIFYSDKKVVFYVYNNMQSDFHYSVQNYLSTKTKLIAIISMLIQKMNLTE